MTLSSEAQAQSWGPLAPQFGTGTAICDTSGNGYLCLAVRCAAEDRAPRLAVYSNRPGFAQDQQTILVIDENTPHMSKLVPTKQAGAWVFNWALWNTIMLEIANGSQITVYSAAPFAFTLQGAAAEIDRTLAECSAIDKGQISSLAELGRILENEPARSNDFFNVQYLKQTNVLSTLLASSQTDASLRGIGAEACVAACTKRADCDIATYTSGQNLCSLKTGFGAVVPDAQSFTTVIADRPVDPPIAAFAGPKGVTASGLRWQPGEQWQGYVARLRDASVQMGGDCQQEANVMGQFVQGLKLTPPALTARAGEPVSLSWTSNPMSQRIPAWMVLSVDKPARFDGDGFYGLNAGALAPFGIQTDAARQRAFAPLYTQGTTDKGTIQAKLLEAGTYTLRATLVSYLRACQQELPLAQMEWTVEVSPSAPQIVLRDVTAKHPYDRRALIPEYNRRIEISDTRFVIQNLTDGSEVTSREGKDLRLSPTKRFVVVRTAGRFRVYDVVDGALVTNIPNAPHFVFWNADSFYLTDTSPWAQITIGATMRPRVFLERRQTGPSCCENDGRTTVGIDLENNFARIQGQRNVSWSTDPVWSLLDGDMLGSLENKPFIETDRGLLGKGVALNALETVDVVAPIQQEVAWNTPLGPFYLHGYGFMERDDNQSERAVVQALSSKSESTIANPDFGKSARVIAQTLPEVTVLRGLPDDVGSQRGAGFAAALERSNVTLLQGLNPIQWMSEDSLVNSRELDKRAASPGLRRTTLQIETDAARVGKSVEWSLIDPELSTHATYCEHFPNDVLENSSGSLGMPAPLNLESAFRFDLGNRVVWVNRARCSGGATGGSIVAAAALHIFDTASAVPSYGHAHVKNRFTLGNEISIDPFERITDAKLFNQNLLVLYAKGAGTLIVYDLRQRKFTLEIEFGRRGDLLEDVFLDASGQHLFQLNTDGSFTIYRIADQAAILEGRYLDDELVVWSAEFHFDATEEGAAFVELRFPGQAGQYSFQQFDQALRVPGLLQTVLNGGGLPERPEIGIPPKVQGKIGVGPLGDVEGTVSLSSEAGVKTLRVFQDGVQTHTIDDLDRPLITFKLPRQDGARWVSLVAEDENGLVSLPLNTDMGPQVTGLPRTHYFGIGVDYYADDRLQALNYAKLDTVKMADSFGALSGKTIDLVSDTVLTDRRASRDTIVDSLARLTQSTQPGDHVVLFFAGHGLTDTTGAFYLGLSSTDLDDIENTALNWDVLSSAFEKRGVRVTVLLDACHAGAAGTDAFATNDAAVDSLLQSRINNVTVLAAAKGRQFSGESGRIGGGFFTEAMKQVLLDARGQYDENDNGVLEAVEFYRGVKTIVVSQRGADQTPWLVRNPLVGEYGLF